MHDGEQAPAEPADVADAEPHANAAVAPKDDDRPAIVAAAPPPDRHPGDAPIPRSPSGGADGESEPVPANVRAVWLARVLVDLNRGRDHRIADLRYAFERHTAALRDAYERRVADASDECMQQVDAVTEQYARYARDMNKRLA